MAAQVFDQYVTSNLYHRIIEITSQVVCTLSDDEQPTRVLSALTDFTTPDYLYKLLPLSYAAKQLPKIVSVYRKHNLTYTI